MGDGSVSRLTERQKDCLRLVASGYTSKEIGRQLGLSPSTVDNHILSATQAMGASSRAEAGRQLIALEARQKLPREPEDLVKPAKSQLLPTSVEEPTLAVFDRKIWSLPPLGGYENNLDGATRTIRMVQVAAVGFGTIMSLAVLIAGVFKLFS
jgi:DNA-binding CsgD family transcriptional regulator